MQKKQKTSLKKRLIWGISLAVVLLLGTIGTVWYLNDYYRATEEATCLLSGTESFTVEATKDYYHLSPRDEMQSPKGLIFYPGGKVEETAYLPLLSLFAEEGYEVYLIRMPAKLAVFGISSAKKAIDAEPGIEDWTLMGHSLGGAMAATFAAGSTEIDRLVLLAAYSTADLKETDLEVYSFYGSEDGVLNREKYDSYHSNLPENVVEAVLDGGNHAQFGNYGKQDGDGEAEISTEKQQKEVWELIRSGADSGRKIFLK